MGLNSKTPVRNRLKEEVEYKYDSLVPLGKNKKFNMAAVQLMNCTKLHIHISET